MIPRGWPVPTEASTNFPWRNRVVPHRLASTHRSEHRLPSTRPGDPTLVDPCPPRQALAFQRETEWPPTGSAWTDGLDQAPRGLPHAASASCGSTTQSPAPTPTQRWTSLPVRGRVMPRRSANTRRSEHQLSFAESGGTCAGWPALTEVSADFPARGRVAPRRFEENRRPGSDPEGPSPCRRSLRVPETLTSDPERPSPSSQVPTNEEEIRHSDVLPSCSRPGVATEATPTTGRSDLSKVKRPDERLEHRRLPRGDEIGA